MEKKKEEKENAKPVLKADRETKVRYARNYKEYKKITNVKAKKGKVTVYYVMASSTHKIVDIVPTQDDAIESVRKAVIGRHYNHFKQWCELHNYDPVAPETQALYLTDVIDITDIDNRYAVRPVSFTANELSKLLCLFTGVSIHGSDSSTSFLEELNQLMDVIYPDQAEQNKKDVQMMAKVAAEIADEIMNDVKGNDSSLFKSELKDLFKNGGSSNNDTNKNKDDKDFDA